MKTQKIVAKNTQSISKVQLSRREMLTLLGGTGGALLSGVTINHWFSGTTTLAQANTAYSHVKDTAPDYNVVFPSDLVNRVVITISPENWQAIQADLTNLLGAFGEGGNRGGNNGNGGQPPRDRERPAGGDPSGNGQPPAGFDPSGNGQPPAGFDPSGNGQPPQGFAGGINITEDDPIWIPVTVSFNDEIWEYVGFRYKGNSTLSGAWSSGSLKIGFKLNFDKFEDDYPEIDNQRFFGFDEMSFSSNYRDTSYLHEKVAADIFRNAGVPAARTAFYAVSLDYGEGETYLGLYTAIEEIDDTVLETQFSDNNGNLYKPEGTGASFIAGTFDEASFEKKTNEDEADFSDILALFDALHDETRLSVPETWRMNLENVLDVGEFVQWLAINTVIQNWDVYGAMAHNFYLYNNPSTGLLTWIPWDNNEALSAGGRNNNNGSLDLTNTGDNWPLISYLMNDSVYHALYVSFVAETINTVFDPVQMTAIYQSLHTLITPYVTGEAMGTPDPDLTSVEAFKNSLTQLIEHVNQRNVLAQEYIENQ